MKLFDSLERGLFIKRYKRFFADIEIKTKENTEIVTAHVPNTGSLKTVLEEGRTCWLSHSLNPKRKLKYTLELVETPSGLAGVNTHTPNIVTFEALKDGLSNSYPYIQREVKISDKSRIDFVLWNWLGNENSKPKKLLYPDYLNYGKNNIDLHFIEVKNVTLAKDKKALFPDAKTERGVKHLRELIHLKEKGFTSEILFFIQRENMSFFSPAKDIDPKYVETLYEAQKKGVKISPYTTNITLEGVALNWQRGSLPLS